MATATLVNQEIEEGQRLIDALNAAGVLVDSALWLYAPEPETWRLMFALLLYDLIFFILSGRRDAYPTRNKECVVGWASCPS